MTRDPAAFLGVTMSERFKKTLRGWIHSSQGYAVRVVGRTGITYRDDRGEIHIDSEAMSSPWNEIVVYTGSIPDTPERPRAEVLNRLHRAFEFAGLRLKREDAWCE
jgi:hypothetical protein